MTKRSDLDLLELAEAVARGDLRAATAETRAAGSADDLRDLTSAIGAVRAHAQAVRSLRDPEPAQAAAGVLRLETAVGAGRVRRRPNTLRGGGRIGRPTALLVAAAFVVGTAAIGLAVGGGLPIQPQTTPLPAVIVATASPVVSTADPDQATPQTLTPAPIVPGQAVLFHDLKVAAVQFAPSGVGWATDLASIHRSTDGGVTWTDVHAPFAPSPVGTRFLDGDTAYIASADLPARIAVTHDGGSTWTTTTIAGDAVTGGRPIFAFQTPDAGTVAFHAYGARSIRVYRTVDGGRSWTGPAVGTVPPGMDRIESGFGPDTGVVWGSNGQADGQPFDDRLVFSLDGGVTYEERSFPIDAHAPAGVLKGVLAFRGDATGQMVLAIGLDTSACVAKCHDKAIYRSSDFGRSWSFIADATDHEVALLSLTDWVMLRQGPAGGLGSMSTTDRGATWQTIFGPGRIFFDAVSIASAHDMWAIHDCDRAAGAFYPGPDPFCDGRTVQEVLLMSSDGGRSWTEVGPS